jgi:hypothetical protein
MTGSRSSCSPPIVIPRECGGSSTPRLIGSIAGVSGILDRPLSRAMTNGGCHSFAISPRIAPEVCKKIPYPPNQRAQGKPDARCTRGPVSKLHKKGAHEHTGPAEAIRLSLRNGFNGCFVLSPAIGLFCHRHRQCLDHRLDASVEASGPHDLARPHPSAFVLGTTLRPPHPHPTYATIMIRPSVGVGCE